MSVAVRELAQDFESHIDSFSIEDLEANLEDTREALEAAYELDKHLTEMQMFEEVRQTLQELRYDLLDLINVLEHYIAAADDVEDLLNELGEDSPLASFFDD